ncbi:hypothetical protein LGM46_23940 [Burkholderia arboris]|nr:hypothetical protein [Burkholderia arboris]MCA8036022.1 hypothetical protein [Burkholderia arboris]
MRALRRAVRTKAAARDAVLARRRAAQGENGAPPPPMRARVPTAFNLDE